MIYKEYIEDDDLYHQAMLEEEYKMYQEQGGTLPFGTWFLDIHGGYDKYEDLDENDQIK